jgi:PEP-CTERM motif
VFLTPGSYDIGFDSYDTRNGSVQPHDATLTAEIAGVQLANFSLSSVSPGSWSSHAGEANIQVAGNYLVSFVFNTPDTPANPDPSNPDGEYNAKDAVIDRAYVVAATDSGGTPIPTAAPEPASLTLLGAGLVGMAALRRRRKSGSPK